MDYIDCPVECISPVYGELVEWLVKEIQDMIHLRNSQLPAKCRGENTPQIYWLLLPNHRNFDHETNKNRSKFNLCLESIVKQFSNMRVIKLKNGWNAYDNISVINNRFTAEGCTSYWQAIDATLQFNIQKRKEYLARELVKCMANNVRTHKMSNGPKTDHMQQFFSNRKTGGNRFRWNKEEQNNNDRTVNEYSSRRQVVNENRFNRFLLPKPPKKM